MASASANPSSCMLLGDCRSACSLLKLREQWPLLSSPIQAAAIRFEGDLIAEGREYNDTDLVREVFFT
jgi:hypothetical protein